MPAFADVPARLQITDLPFGITVSAPARLQIITSWAAPARLQIVSTQIADPTSPLALHLGQGIVFVHWNHPTPEQVDHYQLQAALAVTGPYFQLPGWQQAETSAKLFNLPLGRTIYLQVRASGKNGTVGNWVQVKRGKFATIEAVLEVSGLVGSSIPAGVSFQVLVEKYQQLVQITCRDPILLS